MNIYFFEFQFKQKFAVQNLLNKPVNYVYFSFKNKLLKKHWVNPVKIFLAFVT